MAPITCTYCHRVAAKYVTWDAAVRAGQTVSLPARPVGSNLASYVASTRAPPPCGSRGGHSDGTALRWPRVLAVASARVVYGSR